MSHPVTGIDHCLALVKDLDAAEAQFRRLGFTLSPRGVHSKAKGSANHTIMFPDDYLELLGILAPTELNAERRALLAKGEGLHLISCRIGEAADAGARLARLGLETTQPANFSRPVQRPDGTEMKASFSTLSFTPDAAPIGAVFMCQHKTPEAVWLPELMEHPNGACGLETLLAISERPKEDAEGFARLWAAGAVTPEAGGYAVTTGARSARLLLLPEGELAALYPEADLAATPKGGFAGLRIRTRDMAAARACLAAAGIPCHARGAGLYVSPQEAAGVLLEFVPA